MILYVFVHGRGNQTGSSQVHVTALSLVMCGEASNTCMRAGWMSDLAVFDYIEARDERAAV